VAGFVLTSDAFADGEPIPRRHTCDGDDLSPALSWSGTPPETLSFALVVDDPDAPVGTFTHRLAWGIPAEADGLREGEPAPGEGRNGFGSAGWRGPCPPPGDGPHRYFFRLHALDAEPALAPGADRQRFERAIEGHVLATAELVGLYER
jgi:Raf kinase inhibitor-like YbhB/YbcL family protein